MKTYTANNLSEYLALIEKICKTDEWLFRGQREDWPMLPKLSRITSRSSQVEKSEQSMVQEFRRHVGQYVTQLPTNDWDLLSIAQHHGMATRLLDCTLSPLVALWFAVERPALSNDRNAVVYMFKYKEIDLVSYPEKISPFALGRTLFFVPQAITSRIRVQRGYFSVHRQNKKDKWISLQNNHVFRRRLVKVEVSPRNFSTFRYSLDQCGVNRASLFPDLDGLCAYLTWSYTIDTDE